MASKSPLLDKLLKGAKKSTLGLRKLNFVMAHAIPFNKPHGIKVQEISDEKVLAFLPYKKRNLNHLKGMHAAALMTVGEYCSGIWLMNRIGSDYRLIMKSINVDYQKQGRTDVLASYFLSESDFNQKIKAPLERDGKVFHTCEVQIENTASETLAVAKVEWQIKDWNSIKKR